MCCISSSERVVNIKFWPRFQPTFPGALKLPMCYYIPVGVPSKRRIPELSDRTILSCRTFYEVMASEVGHEAFIFLSHWSALCRRTYGCKSFPCPQQPHTTSMTPSGSVSADLASYTSPFCYLHFHISFRIVVSNNTPRTNT